MMLSPDTFTVVVSQSFISLLYDFALVVYFCLQILSVFFLLNLRSFLYFLLNLDVNMVKLTLFIISKMSFLSSFILLKIRADLELLNIDVLEYRFSLSSALLLKSCFYLIYKIIFFIRNWNVL